MIKAVIFDLDGLMVDTEPLHSEAFRLVIEEYGGKPVYHQTGLVQVAGIRGVENLRILKEKYEITESVEVLRIKKLAAYQKILKENNIKPRPGLIKLIKSLLSQKLKIAIASNSAKANVYLILQKINLFQSFTTIVGVEDVKKGKPYPDLYLETASRLQVEPENCLALEDSETGVSAAKAAGMKVIAIPNIYTNLHNFNQADMIVKSLKSITSKLLSSL